MQRALGRMMLNPVVVRKTLDERMAEYSCIFSEGATKNFTIQEVKKQWSIVVELDIGSTRGWQALWKIPRVTCASLNISFPITVFVEVEKVNSNDLTALVKIVAVEDDIVLPVLHQVMLIHLHPTEQQQNSDLFIHDIANCLDALRFFYNNIWQPWDEEQTEEDWVSTCLKPRMKLFCDVQAGRISSHVISYIRHLMQDAKYLYKRKSFLEMKMDNSLKSSVSKEKEADDTASKENALELMEIKQQWNQVRSDIGMVENPLLREKMIESRQKRQRNRVSPDTVQNFIVWKGGDYDKLLELMSTASANLPQNALIKPCDFKMALTQADENDTIFLCEGTYKTSNDLVLMRSGMIKGFPCAAEVILSPEMFGLTLIDWSGVMLKLDNLTLTGEATQALIFIRSGAINANNCRFVCDSLNSSNGLCIKSSSIADLTDCQLHGFDAGVIVEHGAMLYLRRCRISSCIVGIQIHEESEVYLKESSVKNCLEYGLVINTNKSNIEDASGTLELLKSWENVQVEDIEMEGNARADVHISALPSSDLFNFDIDMQCAS